MNRSLLQSNQGRWLLGGGIFALGFVFWGVAVFFETQGSDPHRRVREAYSQQQKEGARTDTLNASSLSASLAPITYSEDQNLRKIDAFPGKIEELANVKTNPPMEVSTDPHEKKVIEREPVPPPLFDEPAIPLPLLDQTPPLKRGEEETRVMVAPNRYRFNNQSIEALVGAVVVTEDHPAKDFNLESFSPEMEDIDLALMDHIHSSALELDVAAGVWTPFYFQGHQLLEVGDKLRGQASPGRERDRLIVKFTKVIKKDGRSLPIQGISLAEDGTLGIPGEKVGNLFQSAAGPLLAELIKGISESFQDRERAIVSGTGSTVKSDLPTKNFKNAGIRGSQRVLDKVEELMNEDLEEHRPYLFIRAGSRLRCRLQVAIDFSQADYGK